MRVLIGPGMIPKKNGGSFGGGGALVVWNLFRQFQDSDADVDMCIPDKLNRLTISTKGLISVGGESLVYKLGFIIVSLINILILKKNIIKTHQYYYKKSVHSFLFLCYYYCKFYKIIKKNKYDLVNLHGHTLMQSIIFEICIVLNVKVIVTSHGLACLDENIWSKNSLYDVKKLEEEYFKLIKSKGTWITAVSNALNMKIKNSFDIDSGQVIYNGYDSDLFKLQEVKSSNIFRLLTVGTLMERKNQLLTLEALTLLKKNVLENIKLVLIGKNKNNYLNVLNEYILLNGLEKNVEIVEHLDQENIVEHYNLSNCFILNSTSEGFPLVFFEALSCGLPIISVKTIEGVNELIEKIKVPHVYVVDKLNAFQIAEMISVVFYKKDKISKERKLITNSVKSLNWVESVKTYLNLYYKVINDENSYN